MSAGNNNEWSQAGWLPSATSWIEARLSQDGLEILEPLEQVHLRPWSTVFRVPTNRGNAYFKATSPALRHEAAVTQALFDWRPNCIPQVYASDPDRGWLLLADGGTLLREWIKTEEDIQHWESLLPVYAEFQKQLSEKVNDLLKLGVPDRRLDTLPHKLTALTNDLETRSSGQLSSLERAKLLNFLPKLTVLCKQLSHAPIPQSLHHGDLHDGNIFFHDGQYDFFDWGDCSLTHPFFSMRTAFVSIENTLGIEENSPYHDRLMHAYLEPWTTLAPSAELVDIFRAAERVSPLCSALSWQLSPSDLDTEDSYTYTEAIPSLLRELLELNPTD